MHYIPCCDLTYSKYIHPSGEIDWQRLYDMLPEWSRLKRACNQAGKGKLTLSDDTCNTLLPTDLVRLNDINQIVKYLIDKTGGCKLGIGSDNRRIVSIYNKICNEFILIKQGKSRIKDRNIITRSIKNEQMISYSDVTDIISAFIPPFNLLTLVDYYNNSPEGKAAIDLISLINKRAPHLIKHGYRYGFNTKSETVKIASKR
jgi:hypothetical protein